MEEPTYDPSRPMPSIDIVYQYRLVNCPGKSIVGLRIEFPPNGSTPPHRHGGASVSAYVIGGSVLNKMNNDPMKVIKPGGTWYEAPGCHHRISDNASETAPATLMANMVLDTDVLERDGMAALIQIDEEYTVEIHRPLSSLNYSPIEAVSRCSPRASSEGLSSSNIADRQLHTAKCLSDIDHLDQLLTLPTNIQAYSPFIILMITNVTIAHLSACRFVYGGEKVATSREKIRLTMGTLKRLSEYCVLGNGPIARSVLSPGRYFASSMKILQPV
ncbi:cupin domain protein [Penicillium alfredii]|uniref:Cupin domain protein n=1 Tax=Penicillium alfredii TaxID=1506179 RepID=A0A9W9FJB9_9EURO|nr:cupin domain protein [Penicillium alfredii]KAJ5101301.1 cupin domain protein [Penicillium alfredii]